LADKKNNKKFANIAYRFNLPYTAWPIRYCLVTDPLSIQTRRFILRPFLFGN